MVVLGVGDAGAGAHDLHIAGLRAPFVAQLVDVRDRAAADVGDDLHVAVRVHVEPGLRLDDVVVPDDQRTDVAARRIVVFRKIEMKARIQPVVLKTPVVLMASRGNHYAIPFPAPSSAPSPAPANAIAIRAPSAALFLTRAILVLMVRPPLRSARRSNR